MSFFKLNKSPSILFLLLFIVACNASTIDTKKIAQLGIKNFDTPANNVFSSGQPTKKELSSLAKLGVKHIVNLRPAQEQSWSEADYVASLGMQYHYIPVAGALGITVDNAAQLTKLLETLKNEPTLVHCSSSNRVGALVAINARAQDKNSIEQSIEKGRGWGLKGLEALVREKLSTL